MTGHALGIAYPLWLRTRWLLAGVSALLLAMHLGIRMFPDAAEITVMGGLLLPFALAMLLNIFSYGPADLGGKGSGFPTHMLLLPMRTRALAGWPMLYGAVTVALVWVLLAVLVFIPAGSRTPIVWPATILAAVTVWVQALAWSLFPSPLVRVPLLLLVVCPPIALAFWAVMNSQYALVLVTASAGGLAWTMAGYGIGVLGLSQTRSGNDGSWLRLLIQEIVAKLWKQSAADLPSKPHFRSANAAQLWYDFRRNVMYMPYLLALLAIPMAFVLCRSVINPSGSQSLMIGTRQIPTAAIGLGILIFFPVLLSALAAPNIAKSDFWVKQSLPGFFAIRPLTTEQLIRNKFKAAAISAALSWGVVLAVLAVLAMVEMSGLNPRPSLLHGMLAEARPRDILAAVLVAFAFWLLIWRNLMIGMFPMLTGRKWFTTCLAMTSGLFVFSLPGIGGWIYRAPHLQGLLIELLPWFVGVNVALKLCGAIAVSAALLRSGILPGQTVAKGWAVWLAAVCGVVAILALFGVWSWYAAAGVIIFVPLTRIGLAPLALAWNRHR